jgi:uncharacterized protein YciI
MGYFHLKLIAPRPTFPFDITEAEGRAMAEHVVYWRQLATDGHAVAVGPVFDPKGAYGLAIVETENEAEAEALGAADPVTRAGLGFTWEVAPMPSIILRELKD